VTNHHPRVSIAVPAYNEEEVLPLLLTRVRAVLAALPGGPHELVIVDDGSSDGSLALLEREAAGDRGLRVVALARNFGQQAAVTAALDHVTGEVAIVMDADLQDAPEAIPEMIDWYRRGYDVVYAQRASRPEGFLLRAGYYLAYRIISGLADLSLPLDAGDFALMSRRVVNQLKRLPEHQRYVRGLRTWVGFRQVGIPVHREPRASGRSKYTFTGLFQLATDGMFAFSTVPLRVAALIGACAIALSSLYALYAVVVKLMLDRSPQGFTGLLVTVTFLAGVQLLVLGVLGEYLGRVYEEVKARPIYVVDRVINRVEPPGVASEGA